MNLREFLAHIRFFGFWGTFYDLLLRIANRFFLLKIYVTMILTKDQLLDPTPLSSQENIKLKLAKKEDLDRFSSENENQFSEDFFQQMAKKGDECFAVFAGDVLASYSWFSTQETQVIDAFYISFPSSYAYMYKGLTYKTYRGKQFYGHTLAEGLRYYVDKGYDGLISVVENNNFNGKKAFLRLGFRPLGKFRLFKLGRFKWVFQASACKGFGVRIRTKV